MKIVKILQDDLANGPGLRTSVFVSGCEHNCPECHAADLRNFSIGVEYTEEIKYKIEKLLFANGIQRHLSFLGGDPLHPHNFPVVMKICEYIKEKHPEVSIWVWTGYTFEDLLYNSIYNLLFLPPKFIDVIIDGKYEKDNPPDEDQKWVGSANQRIFYANERKNSVEWTNLSFFKEIMEN